MDFELAQNKREEVLQLLDELDEDKCLLNSSAKEIFISKYFHFTQDDAFLEAVSTLHIDKDKVESRKIGNILFNLRHSIDDALGSLLTIGTGIHSLQTELQVEDITQIKKENVIILILRLILALRKLSIISLDRNSAKVIIRLHESGAYIQGIDESTFKQSISEVANLDDILNNLVTIGCIDIDEGKIILCETVKLDWMG